MLEWSNDDENQTAHRPSTKEPSKGAEVPEQQARESHTQAMTEVPAVQTAGVPQQQGGITAEQHTEEASGHQAEQQPSIEEQELSRQADRAVVPGGSGRHRRFKKLNRKTKP